LESTQSSGTGSERESLRDPTAAGLVRPSGPANLKFVAPSAPWRNLAAPKPRHSVKSMVSQADGAEQGRSQESQPLHAGESTTARCTFIQCVRATLSAVCALVSPDPSTHLLCVCGGGGVCSGQIRAWMGPKKLIRGVEGERAGTSKLFGFDFVNPYVVTKRSHGTLVLCPPPVTSPPSKHHVWHHRVPWQPAGPRDPAAWPAAIGVPVRPGPVVRRLGTSWVCVGRVVSVG
jgi:hypothetical protein